MYNFVKYCLSNGAVIRPLVFDAELAGYTGICNPSVLADTDGKIKTVLRNVNYAMFKNEDETFVNDTYGPLCYITPDNYSKLATKNFVMADNGNVTEVDTSMFDAEPKWDFIGLEDARVVRWDGKLYLTGVRRDVDSIGTGRMELSELDENTFAEVRRVRIEVPKGLDASYCEKNWMPILDMPFCYVRWCDPLQIMKADPETGRSEIILEKKSDIPCEGVRGSSQVITVGDRRMAIVHRCQLWLNEKGEKVQSEYIENFIVWDMDWNTVCVSEEFSFADFDIEFTNGLAYTDGKYIIPFALQDSMSFMMAVGKDTVDDFIYGKAGTPDDGFGPGDSILLNFFSDTKNSYYASGMADWYYESGQYAAAMALYYRSAQYNTPNNLDFRYRNLYMVGMCLARMGGRDSHEANIWCRLIEMYPNRSEAYIAMSRFCYFRNRMFEAYMYAAAAERKKCYKDLGRFSDINETSGFMDYIKAKYSTERYAECEKELEKYLGKNKTAMNDREINSYIGIMLTMDNNKKKKVKVL